MEDLRILDHFVNIEDGRVSFFVYELNSNNVYLVEEDDAFIDKHVLRQYCLYLRMQNKENEIDYINKHFNL